MSLNENLALLSNQASTKSTFSFMLTDFNMIFMFWLCPNKMFQWDHAFTLGQGVSNQTKSLLNFVFMLKSADFSKINSSLWIPWARIWFLFQQYQHRDKSTGFLCIYRHPREARLHELCTKIDVCLFILWLEDTALSSKMWKLPKL